jgi:RNA polymerase sigma-70 factor, ECF subfamily
MAHSFLSLRPVSLLATDEQAMWRVKMNDDAQAFARLVQRWEKPIQRLCTRMTGSSHQGEDLAQETFTRLFTRRKNYEPSRRFSTFLWRIALNLCYDELRKTNRRHEFFLDEIRPWRDGLADGPEEFVADEPAPDAVLADRERAATVRRALLELAEPYRVVVVLRHYEGLKFRQIAEVLDIPEGTVKSRMAEAMSQLNRRLSDTLCEGDICKTQTKRRPSLAI